MADAKLNLNAITAAVGIIADAAADTKNALGQASIATKVEDYGNLVPDLLGLVGKTGALPNSIGDVPAADLNQTVAATAAQLDVSHPTATSVISAVITLLSSIGQIVVKDADAIAALFQKR